MSRRRRAREVAFQVLYQDDLNTHGDPAAGDALIVSRLRAEDQRVWASELVGGFRKNRGEVDALIGKVAQNWSLHRMAATDRNLLRLGTYEIVYTDTPPRVAINEAVELAKRFGGAQSAHFINGILDKVMHESDKEA